MKIRALPLAGLAACTLSSLLLLLATADGRPAQTCDAERLCPRGHSCCESPSGKGCCPYSQGTCCADGKFCCPRGSRCDADNGICVARGVVLEQLPVLTLTSAERPSNSCGSACMSGDTCCVSPTASGRTAGSNGTCCPLPKAVCCSDGSHCCPHGYTCDDQPGICRYPDAADTSLKATPSRAAAAAAPAGGDDSVANQHLQSRRPGLSFTQWLEKLPVISFKPVKCDASYECPTDTTCCKLSSGDWGCCPLPQAVCCSDGEHCCPHATTCNLQNQTCDQGGRSVQWFGKVAAAVRVAQVECDASYECPTDTTCCKLPSGDWGCCPLPQAVCCSDGEHCCPQATTCNLQKQTCDQGVLSLRWFARTPAQLTVSKPVKCDASHECPSGTTCCKLQSGDWGCCPLPQAVCCSDGEHCCPHATTCNLQNQTCDQGAIRQPWFAREAARQVVAESSAKVVRAEVTCSGSRSCPEGNTCCTMEGGDWSCCPLENAVCCSDRIHCCPAGSTCDIEGGRCRAGLALTEWHGGVPSNGTRHQDRKTSWVMCDYEYECPDGSTCCLLNSGRWGCCPYPQATCCEDGLHCCPNGYQCDVADHTCVLASGDGSMATLGDPVPASRRAMP